MFTNIKLQEERRRRGVKNKKSFKGLTSCNFPFMYSQIHVKKKNMQELFPHHTHTHTTHTDTNTFCCYHPVSSAAGKSALSYDTGCASRCCSAPWSRCPDCWGWCWCSVKMSLSVRSNIFFLSIHFLSLVSFISFLSLLPLTWVSFKRSPVTPDLASRSEPAKSTRFSHAWHESPGGDDNDNDEMDSWMSFYCNGRFWCSFPPFWFSLNYFLSPAKSTRFGCSWHELPGDDNEMSLFSYSTTFLLLLLLLSLTHLSSCWSPWFWVWRCCASEKSARSCRSWPQHGSWLPSAAAQTPVWWTKQTDEKAFKIRERVSVRRIKVSTDEQTNTHTHTHTHTQSPAPMPQRWPLWHRWRTCPRCPSSCGFPAWQSRRCSADRESSRCRSFKSTQWLNYEKRMLVLKVWECRPKQ